MQIKIKKGLLKTSKILFLILTLSATLSLLFTLVHAAPIGPTITVLGNTTKVVTGTTKVNSTNGTEFVNQTPGGFIFTLDVESRQQNSRWKAYVGNVTGTLALDDASENTIFQWSLTTVTGEIYATRASGSVNWSGINCTWIYEGSTSAVASTRSAEEAENAALSHTNKDDNITATFDKTNHSSIDIGGRIIGKDECFSVQTWQNDAEQVFPDSDEANFTQVILYDGAFDTTNGNIVYTTKIEDDITGYDSSETYDFQMLLPENGASGFSGSTAYYFYVELT
jgi:hypothetical protein